MDITETAKQTLNEVTEGAKEGLKKGGWRSLRHLTEETIEMLAFAGGGAITSLFFKQRELRQAKEKADALVAAGKHEEAASFLEAALSAFTLSDETAAFKVLPRVMKHFNQQGETEKANALLDSLSTLSHSNLHRWREILMRSGGEDKQFEKMVEFGEATAEQQIKILTLTDIANPPENQPGHVVATELRRVATSQRDKSNANVEAIKARIRARRASRQQIQP